MGNAMTGPDAETTGDQDELLGSIDDAFVRGALSVSLHLRRYLPFYVFTGLWALMLTVVPSIRPGGEADMAGGTAPTAGQGRSNVAGAGARAADGATRATVGAAGAGGATAATTRTGAPGPAQRAAAAEQATAISIDESLAVAQDASGVTRDGRECAPGVRQLPISTYATQCRNVFSGDNGGATFRGVTAEEIIIVDRNFPDSANSEAAAQIAEQAGAASEEETERVEAAFRAYFADAYELYGRKIKWVEWESQNGNSTEEAQGRGREGACADATYIQKELGAFAVEGGSAPFGECAAERGLMVLSTAPYYPESYYRQFHPFLWGTVMECERIAYQVGEYMNKRLVEHRAKWAGDALYQQQDRAFGMFIPDNDGYQVCGNIIEETIKGGLASRYNYQLDLSRLPDQATQGMVQFKADGVTTIINTCDPYSTLFMTQAAARQNYYPEWYIIGVALQDVDNVARLFDQTEVDGHLFGMSQLGPTEKLIGENSEPGRLFHHITGEKIPDGTSGNYYGLVNIYNLLQSAGPSLTPDAIAAGAPTIPAGGAPDFAAGYWSYADAPDGTPGGGDHTNIDDSREVYWRCDWNGSQCTYPAPDGKTGHYIETYNGRRFRNGEWPAEEPPIYPDSG
jgi:hypothetical protein